MDSSAWRDGNPLSRRLAGLALRVQCVVLLTILVVGAYSQQRGAEPWTFYGPYVAPLLLAVVGAGFVSFVTGTFTAWYRRRVRWLFLPWGSLCLFAGSCGAWFWFFGGYVLFFNAH